MKKQYTKQEIHDAMKRLLDVDFEKRERIREMDCLIYATQYENYKMVVDLSTGIFSGYELDTKEFVPPSGAIQSIKGM